MKLPTTLTKTFHKHGGRIVSIENIGHAIDKPADGRSRDTWFFVGDVEWDDGTKSQSAEIAPYCLAADDQSEVHELLALMNDYLAANGEWFDSGKHQGWYAHRGAAR